MNNDKGKLYYGVGLDNAQLRADANESKNIIRGIGDSAASEGNRIDGIYRKIGGAIAVVFSAREAAEFAKHIVQVRGEIESLQISFETLAGKSKGNALFGDIKQWVASTPMMMQDAAKGAQMLLSFNVEAERVMPILKQIGDISMGDAQKFNSLTLAFSQMSSTGKLMGQDLLQMINAGFNPLSVMSEKTGKSVAQLKEEMAAGAITSEMVADAFAAATAEGGKFYGMLEKQSKGINGSISNLKGAVDDMFNELGTSNQEFITESIQGATNIVRHYDEIGKIIAELIVAYGLYKAAVISVEAVQQSITTVKHTEEAASLYQLLSAEQQAKISKQGLSKSSAEYYALVKAETAANVQATQSTLAKARADVKSASESVVARRAEYIAAKQLEEQRLAELMSIGATGSAKQVEAAQRKLTAAETQRESAAIAFQSATRDFNAKKTAVETAARTANTTATTINTASQTANATATGFLTVAKNRLAAVAARLNAVIMANPYALAAAAVIALGYGIYKLATYQTEAEKAQSKLNATIKEADRSLQSETYQIDLMFARLKAAKKGTEEYEAAKKAIINQYGDYLKKLGDEKTALNDVAAAYALITEEATKAANARAIQQVTEEAGNIVSKKSSDSYDEVKELLDKKFKGKKGADGKINLSDEYLIKLRPVIMKGEEITPDIEAIIKQFDKTRYVPGDPMTGIGAYSYTSNALREELNSLLKVRVATKKTVQEALAKYGEVPTTEGKAKNTFDATTASLQQLMDRLPKAKEELAALKKAEQPDASAIAAKEKEIQQIKDQTLAREKSLSAIKDVKAQIKLLQDEQEKYGKDDAEYKALATRIKSLKTKLPATEGQSSKAENDEDRIKRETAERNQKIKEYSESVAKQLKQSELDIAQARIDAMDDGFDKELAVIALNYDKLIAENQKRQDEWIRVLTEQEKSKWLANNPDKSESQFTQTFDVSKLTDEQRKALAEYVRIAEQYRLQSEDKLTKDLLEKYRSYEQQRVDINKRFDAERKAIEKSNISDQDKEIAIKELENIRLKSIRSVNDAEVNEASKSSNLLVNIFTKSSELTRTKLKDTLTQAKQLIKYLSNIDNAVPEGISKEVADKIKKSPEQMRELFEQLNALLEDYNQRTNYPFANFIRGFQELKKSATLTKKALKETDAEKKKLLMNEAEASKGKGLSLIRRGAAEASDGIVFLSEKMKELAEISGDERFKEGAEMFSAMSQNFAAAGKGAASGGWIGAIIGGASDMISQFVDGAATAKAEAMEFEQNRIDFLNDYQLMLLKVSDEDYESAFGVRALGKCAEAALKAKEALSKYSDELTKKTAPEIYEEINNLGAIIFTGGLFGWGKSVSNESKVLLEAYKKGYTDIQAIAVKTRDYSGWANFWGKQDKYTSLKDLAPQLWDDKGEFNVEAAKKFLETNTQITEEQRNQIQNAIDLYDAYEDNMKILREDIKDTFGNLGDAVTDSLVNAIMNGVNAWDDFTKAGATSLEKLGKKLAYELFFASKFDDLQKQLEDSYELGDAEDIANRQMEILNSFFTTIGGDMENAQKWMEMWQEKAAELGFDLWAEEERDSSKRGIATASQESVDENNGRLTAIQGHTYSLVEYSRQLVANTAMILDVVMGIKEDTKHLERLESIEDDMQSVKNTVNDIALKGIKLK